MTHRGGREAVALSASQALKLVPSPWRDATAALASQNMGVVAKRS